MLYSYTKIKLQNLKSSPNQNSSKISQLMAIIFPHRHCSMGGLNLGAIYADNEWKMLEFPTEWMFEDTICNSQLCICWKAHLLLVLRLQTLAFLFLNPRGRSQGSLPREIWMVGSQLSQLSLCPCRTQSCMSCPLHRETLFKRNSCWRHCCSLPLLSRACSGLQTWDQPDSAGGCCVHLSPEIPSSRIIFQPLGC